MTEPKGFQMGSHRFYDSSQAAPLDRSASGPHRPLADAIPPGYLLGKTKPLDPNGPARLLLDGSFCGRGEPIYGVFDICCQGCDVFTVEWSGEDTEGNIIQPMCIFVRPVTGEAVRFPIYDAIQHPAAQWLAELKKVPTPLQAIIDRDGQLSQYRLSVGFEYPADCASPNDTSWFALAAEDVRTGGVQMVIDDETA